MIQTKVIFILIFIVILSSCQKEEKINFNGNLKYDTYIDIRDGKEYKTIEIDEQVWLAENLALNSDCDCPYGLFYQLNDLETIAPEDSNWRIPSVEDWTILAENLGGFNIAGGKLKERGSTHWKEPNTNATNSSGFSALPSGLYYTDMEGFLIERGESAYFWTSTFDESDNNPYLIKLSYNSEKLEIISFSEINYYYPWLSIRLIKN